MARFDWEQFLRSRRIDYTSSGARNIITHCPFCGPDDPSMHMSVSLLGRGYRCLRAPANHVGRSPARLVQKLIGCTEEEARQIVGGDEPPPPPTEDVLSLNSTRLARLRGGSSATPRPRHLEMPANFHPLMSADRSATPFIRYLTDVRGYRLSEVRWLAETYDLRWVMTGPYKWRLIFPVKDRRGNLLTWTARAVGESVKLRYKQPPAGEVVTEAPRTLFGLDRLWAVPEPRALVVCEGTTDAMRISVAGAPLGVWATCLFGLGLSDEQAELLGQLADRFPRAALLVDPEAENERLRMVRALTPMKVVLPRLPTGVEDPGAMTTAQATRFCLDLVQ